MKSSRLFPTLAVLGVGAAVVSMARRAQASAPPTPVPPGGGDPGGGNVGGIDPDPGGGTLPADFDLSFPANVPIGAEGFLPPVPSLFSVGAGDGLDWANALPHTHGPNTGNASLGQWGEPGPERESALYAAITGGMSTYGWSQVVMGPIDGTYAIVPVLNRTLRIGQTRPVRITVDYLTHQHIVDLLGGACMTPKVADASFAQASFPLQAMPENAWPVDGTMAATSRMIEYSLANDQRVHSNEYTRLVANESKLWILTGRFWNDPTKRFVAGNKSTWWAANYGWWSKSAPNGKLYQSTGLAHNFSHVDYSQQIQCMGLYCMLRGKKEGLAHVGAVLRDPVLSALLSDEGVLPSWKHPAFPVGAPPPLPGQVPA